MLEEDIIKEVLSFRDNRDWKKYHNSKDLAISINLEAAELLENFQWTDKNTEVPEKRGYILEELADVFIYCIMMADVLDVDINEIIKNKLKKNEEKHKIEETYNNENKYLSE